MTDKKTYSDPSRSGGSEPEKSSHDRSLDRDREKNLGSRHSGDPGTSGSSGRSSEKDQGEGRSSSDRDR